MHRISAFFLLAASAAWGQFQNLAATDEGDQLYFSSPLRQTGSDQFLHPKIFQWRSEGFRLVTQRERQGPGPRFNPHELIQPDISGDGSAVTFVGYSPCFGGSSCVFHEYYHSSQLTTEPEPVDLGAGRAQLSRSGRYAVVYGSTGFNPGLVERIDLQSDERIPTGSGRVTADRQAITSAGELLLNGFGNPGVFVLWTPSGSRQLVPEFVVDRTAIISDDGSRLIFHTPDGDGYSLWAARTDGTDAQQLALSREPEYAPAISNDGRWVVFEADGSVVLADLVSDARRELIVPEDGVAETTISGLGNVVFVSTLANRLLRVDVASGEVEEISSRVPAIGATYSFPRISGFLSGAPVPGSLNWIRGSGLAGHLTFASIPLPESRDGVEVLLGDAPARIVAVAPEQIVYQIPFEAPLGEIDMRVVGPPAPFEGAAVQLDLQRQELHFVSNGYEAWSPELAIGEAIVVTQDFTALITAANPAREEEIVHLYATGGGPVAAAVSSGVPTPADPLPAVTPAITCSYFEQGDRRPLDTFYVGLAPGLIGVYQVSVRLPRDPTPFGDDSGRVSLTVGCGAALASVPMRLAP